MNNRENQEPSMHRIQRYRGRWTVVASSAISFKDFRLLWATYYNFVVVKADTLAMDQEETFSGQLEATLCYVLAKLHIFFPLHTVVSCLRLNPIRSIIMLSGLAVETAW